MEDTYTSEPPLDPPGGYPPDGDFGAAWPKAVRKPKNRYHHGNLYEASLAHARTIVARGGPMALTMRGLARELGVTAAALVYYFKNVAGLRAAVSERILEEAARATRLRAGGRVLREERRDVARAWSAWAARHPNLYRLAAGETWHESRRAGTQTGLFVVRTPRRRLEDAFWSVTRKRGLPDGDRPAAREIALLIHGLALARVDGVPEDEVHRVLERVLAA